MGISRWESRHPPTPADSSGNPDLQGNPAPNDSPGIQEKMAVWKPGEDGCLESPQEKMAVWKARDFITSRSQSLLTHYRRLSNMRSD